MSWYAVIATACSAGARRRRDGEGQLQRSEARTRGRSLAVGQPFRPARTSLRRRIPIVRSDRRQLVAETSAIACADPPSAPRGTLSSSQAPAITRGQITCQCSDASSAPASSSLPLGAHDFGLTRSLHRLPLLTIVRSTSAAGRDTGAAGMLRRRPAAQLAQTAAGARRVAGARDEVDPRQRLQHVRAHLRAAPAAAA